MADTVIASGSNASMDDLPLWLQATGGDAALNYTAQADRALVDALVTSEGPVSGSAFTVAQRGAGANFSVDVAGGYAVVQGDSVASQGKYLTHSTGTVNVATPSAPGSGTRVHRVIIRIRDKVAAGTNYDWTIELLEDTGSGTPALPASAITLALVSIAAGQASVQTANISDQRITARPYSHLGVLPGSIRWTGGGNLVIGLIGTELAVMTSGTIVLPANTAFMISAGVRVLADTSASTWLFRLRDTNVSGTQRVEYPFTAASSSYSYSFQFWAQYETGAAPEYKVFCVTAQRLSASGSLSMIAGNTQHNVHILAMPIGQSGVITQQASP